MYPGDNEPVPLKRPVAHRGSILLAELVAILLVLEFCITELSNGLYSSLNILSDSQSAVGIISLNWKSTNYTDLIQDIKEHMSTLIKKGIAVRVQWTPGHADIEGNEIADKMAKEAAKEAETLNPSFNIITKSDIKRAVKESTLKKWQRRWDLSQQLR